MVDIQLSEACQKTRSGRVQAPCEVHTCSTGRKGVSVCSTHGARSDPWRGWLADTRRKLAACTGYKQTKGLTCRRSVTSAWFAWLSLGFARRASGHLVHCLHVPQKKTRMQRDRLSSATSAAALTLARASSRRISNSQCRPYFLMSFHTRP